MIACIKLVGTLWIYYTNPFIYMFNWGKEWESKKKYIEDRVRSKQCFLAFG